MRRTGETDRGLGPGRRCLRGAPALRRAGCPTPRLSAACIVPALILLAAASPARAQSCDALVDRVASATKAEVGERTSDYARFRSGTEAGGETTLSLACGGSSPSSVGVQTRTDAPAEPFYALFGQAGNAVTGIGADLLTEAARRALAEARVKRHSTVEAGGALVTCSASRTDRGPLTMCAVIEKAERS